MGERASERASERVRVSTVHTVAMFVLYVRTYCMCEGNVGQGRVGVLYYRERRECGGCDWMDGSCLE